RRQSEIDEAVADRLEREEIEIERQRLEARAKLEQLEQLQAEDELQQALNQVRADVGLDAVAGGSDPAQVQSNIATLLGQLQDLEKQVPDLPDDVKALLADAKGDIHLALRGEEAEGIYENLLKVTEGLIEQANQHKAAILELEIEEQKDLQLLELANQDLQTATRQFLEEIQNGKTLQAEREQINPLHIETLTKVAYAEQAVEISQELAKNSKKLLEDILEKRKEERKARKKAFWNDLLGTLALILDIIGTILLFTPLAPIGKALKIAAGVIRGIQAAINGDWAGALYNIGMAVLSAAGVPTEYKIAFSTAYQAYRASEAGDSTLAFLYVVQGLANAIAAAEGLDAEWMKDAAFADKLILTAAQISVTAYQGSQAIENGDLAGALSNIAGMAGTIGTNFATELQGVANDLLGEELAEGLFTGEEGTWFEIPGVGGVGFDELKKTVETAFIITDAAEEGGTNAWLSGINSVLGVWEEEIQDAANVYFYGEDVAEVAKAKKISPKSIQTIEQNGKTFYVGFDSDGNFFKVPKDNSSVNAEDNSTDYAQSQEEPSPKKNTYVNHNTNQSQSGEANSTDSAEEKDYSPNKNTNESGGTETEKGSEPYNLQTQIAGKDYNVSIESKLKSGYVVFYGDLFDGNSSKSPGHAGMIVNENGKTYVVESIPEESESNFDGGIRKVSFDKWYKENKKKNVTFHKPNGWTQEKGNMIAKEALKHAKLEQEDSSQTDYSISSIIVGTSDQSQSYCTLFVERLLDSQNIGVYSGNANLERENTWLIAPRLMKAKIPEINLF
ncbi:MAG: hypothetical protein O4859_27445, partial [Trichodesmium sp. St18_bin1]|nr:hypothetical protein [Trichodesmium sp. St18_bin1]